MRGFNGFVDWRNVIASWALAEIEGEGRVVGIAGGGLVKVPHFGPGI
jgi:hypothetical protein